MQLNVNFDITFRRAFVIGVALGLGIAVSLLVLGGILLAILLS